MNFKIILIEMPIITKGVSQLPRESSADRFLFVSRLIPHQENHQAETEPDLLGSHFEGRRGQREAAARKVIEEPPRAFSQTKSDLAPKSSGEPCR